MEGVAVVKLKTIEATPETFKEFGQVVEASQDDEEFGPQDAQLDLSQGTPRLSIMHLEDQPLKFSTITHHSNVTQCLGAIGGEAWYLGVAKPSVVDPNVEEKGENVVQSRCGHFFVPPAVGGVQVFKINGPKFLKLNRGTWHAGPLFKSHAMDFYNLELSNTNMQKSLVQQSLMEQIAVVKLKAVEATPENFKEFGQVIEASPDTKEFGPHDAQLDLSQGTPRLYIMNLENQPLKFSRITHHSKVTQCLGSVGGDVWYLGVAKRSVVDPNVQDKSQNVEQSPMGHFFVPPAVDGVQVFKITGPKFLKLERGTWHAGPLFKSRTMNFFNLELNNTNEVDITTHNFKLGNATTFVIQE